MSQEKIFPKGIIAFDKHQSAPEWVLGSVIITPRELVDWITENKHLLTDYKGAKQLKLQLLKGSKGPYFTVDTYQREQSAPMDMQNDFNKPKETPKSDLPF